MGKGQGAKEIGHNLAREQPKFGLNLVRERHIIGHSLERELPKFGRNPGHERNEVWAQFCGRSMKTWAQICKHFTSIFTPLSENTKTAITFFLIRAGRCIIGQGARQYVEQGAAPSEICLAGTLKPTCLYHAASKVGLRHVIAMFLYVFILFKLPV